MDLQQILDNHVAAKRAKEMLNSEQLTIGEIILKLEAIKNKELPIYFDDKKYRPTGFGSWRGSYRELAMNYEGSDSCYEQPEITCQKDEFGYHAYKCPCGGLKEYETSLGAKPTTQKMLDVLNLIKGKLFIGYKGGDFTMGKGTPVWVANYGNSDGFKTDDKYNPQAVVDVEERQDKVIVHTKNITY